MCFIREWVVDGYMPIGFIQQKWLTRHESPNELQPKFRSMESSIRDIFIFWKLSWGLDNDNTLFKKR